MWCTPSVFALKSFAFAAIRNNSMIISSTSLSNQCYPISSFLISFILHDFFAVNGMLPELDLTFELNQPQSGWIWFAQFITAWSLPNKSTIAFHNVFVQIILKLWIKWIICIIFLSIWIYMSCKSTALDNACTASAQFWRRSRQARRRWSAKSRRRPTRSSSNSTSCVLATAIWAFAGPSGPGGQSNRPSPVPGSRANGAWVDGAQCADGARAFGSRALRL